MVEIEFNVSGIPQPRGSKKALSNRATGRAMMVDANAKSGPWMHAVTHEASLAMDGMGLLDGALMLEAVFYFPRPKCHYRAGKRADELRDDAPFEHFKKPDADKLLRAIGDAMTGVVYRDDAQLSSVHAAKYYSNQGGSVLIRVSKLVREEI